MDRVIIKRYAENIDLIEKDMPDVKQDSKTEKPNNELKKHFDKGYKRRFRDEPYGYEEQMTEGMEGYRNQDNVMGTGNSWNDNL